jgi:hypothetical protein
MYVMLIFEGLSKVRMWFKEEITSSTCFSGFKILGVPERIYRRKKNKLSVIIR